MKRACKVINTNKHEQNYASSIRPLRNNFVLIKLLLFTYILFIPVFLIAQNAQSEFEELAKGYQNQGKLAQAAEFYSKSGYGYWNNGNKERAIEMFKHSYELFKSLDNQYASLTVSNNLGLVYLDLENYDQSYRSFLNSLLHARKMRNNLEVFNSLINLSSVSLELFKYQDALTKSLEALNIAIESNNLKSLARSYGLLAESYEKLGDAENAYKYYELYTTIDKKIKAQEIENLKMTSGEEIRKAQEGRRITEIELKIKKGELQITQDSLAVSERLSYERQMEIEVRNAQLKEKEIELRYERHLRFTLITGIIAVFMFLLILLLMFRQKIKDNHLLKLQKEEISVQNNKLNIQNKKITDSIHYGLRIQQAMLPNEDKISKKFDSFIIYKPKDIVSGDFYWYYSTCHDGRELMFVAVADCTGHGVPGAFMSMIGNRLLTEIIIDRKLYDPASILDEINTSLHVELQQETTKSMDGMDIALCAIYKTNSGYDNLIFAGAKRSIIKVALDTSKIDIIEGDHKSIGGSFGRKIKTFTNKEVKIEVGDQLYLYSDGMIDQQNFKRDRFGSEKFFNLIKQNATKPMDKQKELILSEFSSFMNNEEQRDDITILGLKLL